MSSGIRGALRSLPGARQQKLRFQAAVLRKNHCPQMEMTTSGLGNCSKTRGRKPTGEATVQTAVQTTERPAKRSASFHERASCSHACHRSWLPVHRQAVHRTRRTACAPSAASCQEGPCSARSVTPAGSPSARFTALLHVRPTTKPTTSQTHRIPCGAFHRPFNRLSSPCAAQPAAN
jgi:hypothetical protein